jgi:hypothetical protein
MLVQTLPNSNRFLPVQLPAQRVDGSRRHAVAILAFFLLGTLLLTGRAAASSHNPVVVVLGVQQDGRPVARARSAVTQHLLHMGESVLAPALSAEDLLCTSSDCLQRLARSFRADRLVGGEILPNDRNYIIRLWMFDVVQQQPSSTEERCIECTPEQVYELSARGAGKLLDAAPAPPVSVPPAAPVDAGPVPPVAAVPAAPVDAGPVPPAVVPPPAPPVALPLSPVEPLATAPRTARCTPRFYSFRRGVAVGALGGLGALGLATAIGLTAADGSVYLPRTAGYPADITWNYQSQYRAAYALTALTAAGLGAALIDWRKLAGKAGAETAMCEVPRGKWTFKRGVAIGTLGSLLLSGLFASVALTALDGGAYVSDDPTRISTPIPYHFQTAYAVGFAASAGLALGLGLAIGLP